MLCLVINSDLTQTSQLLKQKQRQLYSSFLPIFLAVVGLGSGLTLYIIRPLKRLQKLAVSEIKEYSGEDLSLQGRGNEIQTLSQAFALLLSVIHQHIDGLQQAQETIRQGERFLANIFGSIQDGLVILDKNLNILGVNPATERWFAEALPLVGKQCYAAFHGREHPCNPCPSLKSLGTGEPSHLVFLNPNTSLGVPIWVELYTFPMVDPVSGKITGVIEYFRDITERKKTEEALQRSEEQLRQAQKIEAVGRLAGGVAHDFNNMLTAIGGYCDLLIDDLEATDPHRQDVEEIKKAADRATSLTRQLLAFSRKQIIQPKPLNLNEVISNLDKMLRRLLREDIALLILPAAELGLVMADPGQVEQVIINLALNSRDAMPQGGKLTIETGNVELDAQYAGRHLEVQPGSYVLLAVSDTGIGMTAEARERIFEPFFTTKEQGKGTGLGLSMVHGIVKQSGGHIWVYSEPGQGTTFKIYLPRINQATELASLPPLPAFQDRGAETILVVEDEELVRQVTRRILEMKGYKVLEAAGGPAALSVSEQHRGAIQLLLTDVLMPEMSGKELAERLTLLRPETKVLFMSGHTENAIVHHGVLKPGIAFIQKPFRLEALARKVREVLDATQEVSPGP